ncbi:MAG: serine protease [Firmicutes bacterium]|nr:serine protease [Bacillota bacterium]
MKLRKALKKLTLFTAVLSMAAVPASAFAATSSGANINNKYQKSSFSNYYASQNGNIGCYLQNTGYFTIDKNGCIVWKNCTNAGNHTCKPSCGTSNNQQVVKPGNQTNSGGSSAKPNGSGSNINQGNTNTGNNISNASGYAAEVTTIVNKERGAKGLKALNYNSALGAVAQKKAEDMAKNNYFSHTSPTYGSAFDMLAKDKISYRSAGENIAKGQTSASAVMKAWMNSSGHKANILSSSYSEIGVGCAVSSKGTKYWVQIFKG